MRIPAQAMDYAAREIRAALAGLVDAWRDEMTLRRAAPHHWALVHRYILERLHPVRVFARAHHRRMHRVHSAHAWAVEQLAQWRGGCLADALGLPRRPPP